MNNIEEEINQDDKKTQEQVLNDKPTMYKNFAARGVQYFGILCAIGGILYKVFFDKSNNVVKTKKKVVTSTFANTPVNKGSGKISQDKDISSITGAIANNQDVLKDPQIIQLDKPKLPDVPKIEKITEITPPPVQQPSAIPPLKGDKPATDSDKTTGDKDNNRFIAKNTSSKLPPSRDAVAQGSNQQKNKSNNSNNNYSATDIKEAMNQMFILAGNGPTNNQDSKGNSGGNGAKNDFMIIDQSMLSVQSGTPVQNVNTQKLTNLDTTIATGKFIEAILETAINSQLQGVVRAVVSRDVIGETGTKVLIPMGSRLYGTYSATVTNGQSRLAVIWNKVLRPDGLSISINAQITDQFGRAGIEGDVDNRYLEMFQNSLMISFITLGTAVALDKLVGIGGQSQVVNNNGSVATTNITPANAAAQSVITTAQNIANQITQGLMQQLQPVISVPGGMLITVMVNQDIQIPPYKKSIDGLK